MIPAHIRARSDAWLEAVRLRDRYERRLAVAYVLVTAAAIAAIHLLLP